MKLSKGFVGIAMTAGLVVMGGSFDEDFTFSLPTNGTISLSLTDSTAHGKTPLDFSTVEFGGTKLVESGTGTSTQTFSLENALVTSGSQNLVVTGTGKGSYGGSIDFAAVPEPSTWALMIAGVGMTGGMLRFGRRRGALSGVPA